jgi:hypothetical protein
MSDSIEDRLLNSAAGTGAVATFDMALHNEAADEITRLKSVLNDITSEFNAQHLKLDVARARVRELETLLNRGLSQAADRIAELEAALKERTT